MCAGVSKTWARQHAMCASPLHSCGETHPWNPLAGGRETPTLPVNAEKHPRGAGMDTNEFPQEDRANALLGLAGRPVVGEPHGKIRKGSHAHFILKKERTALAFGTVPYTATGLRGGKPQANERTQPREVDKMDPYHWYEDWLCAWTSAQPTWLAGARQLGTQMGTHAIGRGSSETQPLAPHPCSPNRSQKNKAPGPTTGQRPRA